MLVHTSHVVFWKKRYLLPRSLFRCSVHSVCNFKCSEHMNFSSLSYFCSGMRTAFNIDWKTWKIHTYLSYSTDDRRAVTWRLRVTGNNEQQRQNTVIITRKYTQKMKITVFGNSLLHLYTVLENGWKRLLFKWMQVEKAKIRWIWNFWMKIIRARCARSITRALVVVWFSQLTTNEWWAC